jgi:hypothetical protein
VELSDSAGVAAIQPLELGQIGIRVKPEYIRRTSRRAIKYFYRRDRVPV